MIRRDHRSRKGATAVEMAIIAPILVMILFAITQFSSVFFTRHTLMLAAREGARQLAIEGASVAEAQESAEEYLNGFGITGVTSVSYTHLTLQTIREVERSGGGGG